MAGELIAVAMRLHATDEQAVTCAQRIAACVNACRGYTDDQLTAPDNRLLLLVGDLGVKVLVDQDEYESLKRLAASVIEIPILGNANEVKEMEQRREAFDAE